MTSLQNCTGKKRWIDYIRRYTVSTSDIFEEADWMRLVEKWFKEIHPKIEPKSILNTKDFIDDK